MRVSYRSKLILACVFLFLFFGFLLSWVQLQREKDHSKELYRFQFAILSDLTAGFKGIGEAKAVRVCAALELGRRRGAAEADPRAAVRSSHDASLLFQARLRDLPHEELWVALLNPAHRVVRVARISQGGVNNTLADIRLILKAAIDALASGIILCHNHPSGNLQPSRHDDQLTERVQKAAKLMDIALLDHIILADNRYYSYMDEGRLP